MLHMIVNKHNPESCAFRGDAEEEVLTAAFKDFPAAAEKHGMTVKGSWVNRASHEVFVLVDAPNAHAADEAMITSGLIGRTDTRVVAVISTEEALEDLDEAG